MAKTVMLINREFYRDSEMLKEIASMIKCGTKPSEIAKVKKIDDVDMLIIIAHLIDKNKIDLKLF